MSALSRADPKAQGRPKHTTPYTCKTRRMARMALASRHKTKVRRTESHLRSFSLALADFSMAERQISHIYTLLDIK